MSNRVLHYKIYDDDRIESFPRLTFPIGEYIFDDLNSENEERRLHTHFPRPFPGLFDATVKELFGDVSLLVLKSFQLFSFNGFSRNNQSNIMGTIPDAINRRGDYVDLRVSQKKAPCSIKGIMKLMYSYDERIIRHLHASSTRRCYVLYLSSNLLNRHFDLYVFNLTS